MVTIRYNKTPAQFLPNFDNQGGYSYADSTQNTQDLNDIRKALNDSTIRCAVFTTFTGDVFSNLYIGYSSSYTQWHKVEEYASAFNYLKAALPRGAGINDSWLIEWNGKYSYLAHNAFTLDNGVVQSPVEFKVKLTDCRPRSVGSNFKVGKITLKARSLHIVDFEGNAYNAIDDIREAINEAFTEDYI